MEPKLLSFNPEANTAVVEAFGETRTLDARRVGKRIDVNGFAAQYRTSEKNWFATVTFWESGNVSIIAGYGSGRRQQGAARLVGFWKKPEGR